MYYRLHDGYALRGWQKLGGVLIKRPQNLYRILDSNQLGLLFLCDGITDISSIYNTLSDSQKNLLEYFLDSGIVDKFDKPNPVDEDGVYYLYKNRFIPNFTWSITGRCNCFCRHCFVGCGKESGTELSYEDAIKIIDNISECGGLSIDITGGEPLVRDDFWNLVDYIVSKKINIGQVYSNGFLLNSKILDEFKKRNLRPDIVISFDGIGCHDWLRRVEGAEEKALEAIKLCKEKNFRVLCEMCIHKGNIDSLPETVRTLSRYNIDAIKVSPIVNTSLWEENNEGNILSYREYVESMIKYIPQFFKDGMPCDILISGIIALGKSRPDFKVVLEDCYCSNSGTDLLCDAIRVGSYIGPDSEVMPCMPMVGCTEQLNFPKIIEEKLSNILSDSKYMSIVDKRLEDLIEENIECAKCPYVKQCKGGCRANALISGQGIMGKDPNVCLMWKEGYVETIRQVAQKAIKDYC